MLIRVDVEGTDKKVASQDLLCEAAVGGHHNPEAGRCSRRRQATTLRLYVALREGGVKRGLEFLETARTDIHRRRLGASRLRVCRAEPGSAR
jgi:hypothetical protein